MRPIVTLTTDFGDRDSFVGAVKGVLLSRCPDLQIVDICHQVPPQDVRRGALRLSSAARFFPSGTVHLCVVDPGVGGPRRAIAISSGPHFFVGPDNGVLTTAAAQAGTPWRLAELTSSAHRLSGASQTFHARDVFAPAAAHLAAGGRLEDLGPEVSDPVLLPWGRPEVAGDCIHGLVLDVDGFGNLITNIGKRDLDGRVVERIEIGGAVIDVLSTSYDRSRGLVALVSSDDLLEVAAPLGSAAAVLGVGIDAAIDVYCRPRASRAPDTAVAAPQD